MSDKSDTNETESTAEQLSARETNYPDKGEIRSSVERETCADIGVKENIHVTEEFDFHGEHVVRKTTLQPGDDGHVTVSQELQGLRDTVTLTADVLDKIEEERL